jgi:hypothetical protein
MHPQKFFMILLIVSTTFSFLLFGCSTKQDPGVGAVDYASILDHWVAALNSGDISQFEQLHTEMVTYSSHIQESPFNGRQNIWESIRRSSPSSLEKISLFGQDEIMCLQVSATESEKSFLYVFDFERELISHIYSYSAEYDLSNVPLFEGVEISTDDLDLSERIGVINSQVDYLNDRDFSGFLSTFNADPILYVPPSTAPVTGIDGIESDVQGFVQLFPNVEIKVFRTFGEGNLVCQQVAVSSGPMKSLGFVNVFDGVKVSRVYEYLSRAEIGK